MIEKLKNLDLLDWLLIGIIGLLVLVIPFAVISSIANINQNEEACYALQEQRYETIWMDQICFIKTDVGWFAMNSPEKKADYDALIPLLLINSMD